VGVANLALERRKLEQRLALCRIAHPLELRDLLAKHRHHIVDDGCGASLGRWAEGPLHELFAHGLPEHSYRGRGTPLPPRPRLPLARQELLKGEIFLVERLR